MWDKSRTATRESPSQVRTGGELWLQYYQPATAAGFVDRRMSSAGADRQRGSERALLSMEGHGNDQRDKRNAQG